MIFLIANTLVFLVAMILCVIPYIIAKLFIKTILLYGFNINLFTLEECKIIAKKRRELRNRKNNSKPKTLDELFEEAMRGRSNKVEAITGKSSRQLSL